MKYRSDFVTNSSSSSFLLAFVSRIDGVEQIASMDTSPEVRDTILRDFLSADVIPVDQVESRFGDAVKYDMDCLVDCGPDGWRDSDFKKDWLASHPHSTVYDYFMSDERKAKIESLAKAGLVKLVSDIGGRGYLVEMEYEDDYDLGAEIEHEVLPYQSFTVRTFSHH